MGFVQFDWFTLTIISLTAGSVGRILQKAALREQKNDSIAFSIYFQLLVSLIAVMIASANIGSYPKDINVWLVALLISFLLAVLNILFYYALKHSEVSQVGILSATQAFWVLLGGVIFWSEPLTQNKIIGVILIVFGIAAVYWRKGGFKDFGMPQLLVILCAVLGGVLETLNKYIIGYFSEPATYMVFSFLVPALLTAAFIPGAVKKIKPMLGWNKSNFLIIIGAVLLNFGAMAYYSALKAGGEVSQIGPIFQSTTVLSVILGIVFLNERENLGRKMLGAIIVFLGVLNIKNPGFLRTVIFDLFS